MRYLVQGVLWVLLTTASHSAPSLGVPTVLSTDVKRIAITVDDLPGWQLVNVVDLFPLCLP